jgi:putative ABC transport system permease protein
MLERQGKLVGIIVKFLIRSIYEKKLRTFLILFSIALSSALFFASQAITDNVSNMFVADAKQYFGTADIIIYPDTDSPGHFLPRTGGEVFLPKADYMIETLQVSAYLSPERNKTVSVGLRGSTIEDTDIMSPFYTVDGTAVSGFTGKRVIVSKDAADTYGWSKGDSIELEISKVKHRFMISAIAHKDGFFTETGDTLNMLVPKHTLSAILGGKNLTNMTFIKLKDGVDLKPAITELKDIYKRYAVEEPLPMEDIKNSFASMAAGFMMMTAIVAFMSIFIIYTCFKVIALERLPIIGTFRSIGAARRTTDIILLAESLIYGIIGGAAGCILGLGILYLITYLITPSYMVGYAISLDYSPAQMLSAFIGAVVISLASSVLPIMKVSKIPVKEIVLNAIDKKEKNNKGRYIVGILLLVIWIFLPMLSNDDLALIFDTISMMSSVSGIILLLPAIISGFLLFFEKIYSVLFGNVGSLAAKNLRQNKSILNNIALLTIAISSLITITTISDSVLYEVASFYTKNTDFDIYMSDPDANRSLEQSLLTIDGIDQVCSNYTLYGVDVAGHDYKVGGIFGINTAKFPSFFDMELVDTDDPQALLDALNNERAMIMSTNLRDKFGTNVGDNFTMILNDKEVTYKIIGFQDTMLNNGSIVMIADKYFRLDTGKSNYDELFIKTSKEPAAVAEAICKKYVRRSQYVITTTDLEADNYEVNASIFNAMEAFAYLTLLIGVFGIINNYIISFIQRKRSLAMYRSIGMSRRQVIAMLFVESITGGIIGGLSGVISGLMMTYAVPHLMKTLGMGVPISYDPGTIVGSFILGAVITLIASISPMLRSSKLNLIEALKYE